MTQALKFWAVLAVLASFNMAGTPVHAASVSYTDFSTGLAAPVLVHGPTGSWDESLREKVQVLADGSGGYRMWYVGHKLNDLGSSHVGYATSPDGVTWTKYAGNPIISRATQDQDISVIQLSPTSYVMYVEVNDIQIDRLTSTDGIHWTAGTVVKTTAASPVVWREGSTWYLLYEAMTLPQYNIKLATSSDGIQWIDSPANPVVQETYNTVPDSVIKDSQGVYHLYYHGSVGTWPAIHATSTDLTHWNNRTTLFNNFSSPYVYASPSGELWMYLWNQSELNDRNYYLHYGTPSGVQPNGLVMNYSYDSGTGLTVADISGNKQVASFMGGGLWTPNGKNGRGITFNGISQYVDTGYSRNLPAWTVSTWVNSPAVPSSAAASGPMGHEKNFQINWNNPDSSLRGAAAVSVNSVVYGASFGLLNANTWYLLTATYDGETLKAYKNGALITTNTAPSGAADSEVSTLKFGRNAANPAFFAGTIDDTKIYNRALSDSEVAALVNDIPPPPPLSGPVRYYRLDEASGSVVSDSSSNSIPAATIGAPAWTSGHSGNGFQFNGLNQYVQTNYASNLPFWSVSVWAKSPNAPAIGQANGPINREKNFQINWNHGGISALGSAAFSVGGAWYSASFGPLNANTWYNLIATYDGEVLKTYKNGVLITANSAPSGPSDMDSSTMLLGRSSVAPQYWNGTIDDVLVYDRAISDAEAAQIGSGIQSFDTIPPSVFLSNASTATRGTLLLAASASDNVGVAGVQFKVNNADLNPEDTLFPYSTSWNTLSSPDGSYQVVAVARDQAGNRSTSTPITITVDNTAPALSPTTVTASASTATINWTTNEPADALIEYGTTTSYGSVVQNASLVLSHSLVISGLNASTTYNYRVTSKDTVGNVVTSANKTLTTSSTTANGLQLYLPLNEGAGSIAFDASGNNWNATPVDNPAWVAGKIAGGLQVNGASQYLETNYTINLPVWTVSVWAKSPTVPTNTLASGPLNREKNLQINWNHSIAAFRNAAALSVGGTWYAASFGTLEANTWYKLTATYDGETLSVYKDGVLITANTAPSGPADAETGTLKLGRQSIAAQYWNGAIDEVRIYNRALSPTEVANLP